MQIPVTEASKLIGTTVNRSDKTEYSFPDTLQGKYQRNGVVVLLQNEKLNKYATKFVRKNAAVKGRPIISSETSRKWLHELGFNVLNQKKGVYIDGYEWEDVTEYRKKFIRKFIALGFINNDNAPSEEAAKSLPGDLECPPANVVEKTVVIFHDESIFNANEDQQTQWGTPDTIMIKLKGKGSGIMVSDFIDEHNGYLALNNDEYQKALEVYGSAIKKEATALLEYGEGKDG